MSFLNLIRSIDNRLIEDELIPYILWSFVIKIKQLFEFITFLSILNIAINYG